MGELLELVPTSQWNVQTATAYAKMFHESVAVHAPHDKEPYILKFDLDQLLIMAILRPRDKEHFTLEDLSRGFGTVAKMLAGRRERLPVASVSFLGAKSNAIMGPNGSGKSTLALVLAGHSGFEVTEGEVTYRGKNLLEMEPEVRAGEGIFLAFQYPVAIPGVSCRYFLRTALNAVRRHRGEEEIGAL